MAEKTNMDKKPDRYTVVKIWVGSGVRDFLIAFMIEEEFPYYVAFMYYQGLEKICKGYILGSMATEYESLPIQQAKDKINKLAKNEMGHNLKEMIKKLVTAAVLDKDVFKKRYLITNDYRFNNGAECIEILEKAYLECRYPVPHPTHKKYPISGSKSSGFWNPIGSTELRDFAFELGLTIMKRAEKDFNLTVLRDKATYSVLLKDEDWLRFRRVFLKDDV